MSVNPEKIAVALGLAAPESGSIQWKQWSQWIADAEMLIDARAKKLGVDVDSIDEVKIDYVVREAVVSQVRKPDDATQVTVQIDDGMTSKSYQSGKGRVTILDDWWDLLGLVEQSGAFAVDMAPPPTGLHPPFCSIYFGGSCSCGVSLGRRIYE